MKDKKGLRGVILAVAVISWLLVIAMLFTIGHSIIARNEWIDPNLKDQDAWSGSAFYENIRDSRWFRIFDKTGNGMNHDSENDENRDLLDHLAETSEEDSIHLMMDRLIQRQKTEIAKAGSALEPNLDGASRNVHPIESEIDVLSVEIGSLKGIITVDPNAQHAQIRMTEKVNRDYQFKVKNRELQIYPKGTLLGNRNYGDTDILTIVLPQKQLQRFKLEVGSGHVLLDQIRADQFELDLGSGSVSISGGQFNDLNWDLGSGRVIAELAVASGIIDQGSGDAVLELTRLDHSLNYSLGSGSAHIRVAEAVRVNPNMSISDEDIYLYGLPADSETDLDLPTVQASVGSGELTLLLHKQTRQ